MRLWSIFPLYECGVILLVFMIIYTNVLFVHPSNEAVISPDLFISGVIINSDNGLATIKNDYGVTISAITSNPINIGERWTIKIENNKYILDRKIN